VHRTASVDQAPFRFGRRQSGSGCSATRLTENSATVGYNYIKHSANNGNANTGGSCNGDSGGPIFLADTSIIVGVTSWGIDPNCAGPGFGYRTDIAESMDYLIPFLLP
jgi:secreted trypsin-like serine protease